MEKYRNYEFLYTTKQEPTKIHQSYIRARGLVMAIENVRTLMERTNTDCKTVYVLVGGSEFGHDKGEDGDEVSRKEDWIQMFRKGSTGFEKNGDQTK